LPARGGLTIRPRWPKPIGTTRSTTRVEISSAVVSSWIRSSGCSGVSSSKNTRVVSLAGSSPLIASTRRRAKYRSLSLGGRIWPATLIPFRRPNRRIWLGET